MCRRPSSRPAPRNSEAENGDSGDERCAALSAPPAGSRQTAPAPHTVGPVGRTSSGQGNAPQRREGGCRGMACLEVQAAKVLRLSENNDFMSVSRAARAGCPCRRRSGRMKFLYRAPRATKQRSPSTQPTRCGNPMVVPSGRPLLNANRRASAARTPACQPRCRHAVSR
jgi:hypothetical protein